MLQTVKRMRLFAVFRHSWQRTTVDRVAQHLHDIRQHQLRLTCDLKSYEPVKDRPAAIHVTINISFQLEYTEQHCVNKSKLAAQLRLISAANSSL